MTEAKVNPELQDVDCDDSHQIMFDRFLISQSFSKLLDTSNILQSPLVSKNRFTERTVNSSFLSDISRSSASTGGCSGLFTLLGTRK